MITTLTVEEKQGGGPLINIINKIRGDSIKIDIFRYNETVIREITYKKRRKAINPEKISRAAGSQRESIVCGEGIFENGEAGMYRFYSPRLEARMCSNFALECVRLMKGISKSLKIGILDNSCTCSDIVRDFLKFSDNITVVTSASDEYSYVADEIISDCGASFLLTVNPDALGDCSLLIAPEQIKIPLSLNSRAIVLTIAPPQYPIGGQVYYKYKITLPPDIEAIRPKAMNEVYFASAMYSKARVYGLGAIVPQLAANPSAAQTAASTAQKLDAAV